MEEEAKRSSSSSSPNSEGTAGFADAGKGLWKERSQNGHSDFSASITPSSVIPDGSHSPFLLEVGTVTHRGFLGFHWGGKKVNVWVIVLLLRLTEQKLLVLKNTCALVAWPWLLS